MTTLHPVFGTTALRHPILARASYPVIAERVELVQCTTERDSVRGWPPVCTCGRYLIGEEIA